MQSLGITCSGPNQCDALVWAPFADTAELSIMHPDVRRISLNRTEDGYFAGRDIQLNPGAHYRIRLNDAQQYPDPASRYQPEGVHGPSEVVDPAFNWTDQSWIGIPLDEYIVYELHVGTFTPDGTFDAVIPHLNYLRELGITAVELMPVAQFPGKRNWGYDGVNLFAAHNSYGGPSGLKRLVDAVHAAGLTVILDVVYNHLGPDGNYLAHFGPYFTDRYKTPWGLALNFDGPDSDHVRRLFIENALSWIRDFHIDALRLDAVHAITDFSAKPFLAELVEAVEAEARRLGRHIHLIAESDLNDPRLIRPPEQGGFGLHAQWSDDFHHALHAQLTGETSGYYADFGGVSPIARAWKEGYVYTGQYSPSRRRRHGASAHGLPAHRFVVCAQNHDQIGNRALGDRLNAVADNEALKTATAAVLLSPFIPLLFMGEEFAAESPFLYFVDHTDPDLIRAVREGRKAEFAGFGWGHEPPDPAGPAAFEHSKLDHASKQRPPHNAHLAFVRELIGLRKTHPAYRPLSKENWDVRVDETTDLLSIHTRDAPHLVLLFNFGARAQPAAVHGPQTWQRLLDSADDRWAGPGSHTPEHWTGDEIRLAPHSVIVYAQES